MHTSRWLLSWLNVPVVVSLLLASSPLPAHRTTAAPATDVRAVHSTGNEPLVSMDAVLAWAEASSAADALRTTVAAPTAAVDEPRAQVAAALQVSPVMFIENIGQFADDAHFQVRGGTGTMWLAEGAL
jgi:pyruvate-formate lyase-activating enzyme